MRGHFVLSLKPLAGNSCKVPENVQCPAIIVSPMMHVTKCANTNQVYTQKLQLHVAIALTLALLTTKNHLTCA